MKIKIILEVDAGDLDWGRSAVYPSDNCEGQVVLDTTSTPLGIRVSRLIS